MVTAAEKKAADEAAEKEAAAAKAAAKSKGPKVLIFPGDDGVVMYEVVYTGGAKDEDKKEKEDVLVKVCGMNVVLKKGVPALMSRSCQVALGKIKFIKVTRRNEE